MSGRRSLVAANWKMNGTLESIGPLMEAVTRGVGDTVADIVICPPFVYLSELKKILADTQIALGAQNLSRFKGGAYTGEVSALMLRDVGCQYVIVGHSERRRLYKEDSALVAEKFISARSEALRPILCVGELLEERESGDTEDIISGQVNAVIKAAGIAAFKDSVIAYEPVWAIGTGKTATPEQAQEVHQFIRLLLARHDNYIADGVRILYGGSVKADNAKQLFEMTDIDGGLIGGASLVAEDFLAICRAVR